MTINYLELLSKEHVVIEAPIDLSPWGNPGDRVWSMSVIIDNIYNRQLNHKTNGLAWLRAIWPPDEYWFYGMRAPWA